MFAIEPYSAERKLIIEKDGKLLPEWQACRVMGIAMVDDRPVYVVEEYDHGERWLDTVDLLRTRH